MKLWPALAIMLGAASAGAQLRPQPPEWTSPHDPVRIFGNTYYVGTYDLASILITSPSGHVLIDGGVPEAVPQIERNIERLGFRIRDVKVILNSHAHFDHGGGIAELQRASGATVEALPWSAAVLRAGVPARDDPQYGVLPPTFPAVASVKVIKDGDTVHVGALAMIAHKTAGHTPSGTTWTWRSCDGARCVEIAYVDSQTPVSADDFYFTHNTTYPAAIADFEHGFSVLEHLRCDILLTPHASASSLWDRIAKRDAGDSSALVDSTACSRFAASARERLAARIAKEKGTR
jgi:metallo-beta-lactamase class B